MVPASDNKPEDINIQTKFTENLKQKYSLDEIERLQTALNHDDMLVNEYIDLWVRQKIVWIY